MNVDIVRNGDTLRVEAEGRIDTVTAPAFEAKVKQALDGVTELIIDFSGIDYISSAGLRALLILLRIMNKQGTMLITGASENIRKIFEMTGFSGILSIEYKE